MPFVEVLDQGQVFPWSYRDPDTGTHYTDTVLQLRQLPPAERRKLEQRHTKTKCVRGIRRDNLDPDAFSADALDYVIVAWKGVKGVRIGKDGQRDRFDLDCNRENKLALPEMMKIEISRICVARAAPDDDEDEAGGETPFAAPPPASPSTSTG